MQVGRKQGSGSKQVQAEGVTADGRTRVACYPRCRGHMHTIVTR